MDDSRSVGTCTTRGGADFDALASRDVSPYYAFRLLRLDGAWDLYQARDNLVNWLDDTLSAIAIMSGKRIAKFYIGKTSVRTWRNRQFNPMDPNTWRKGRISSRWHHHKTQDYGRSGMVVLTVVSRRVVPADSTPAFNHQELYALALEQQLITHYAYMRGDQRLANESIHPGHQSRDTEDDSGAIGHPIYVAYSLDDTPDDDETADDHGATGDIENESNTNYNDDREPGNSPTPNGVPSDSQWPDGPRENYRPIVTVTAGEYESESGGREQFTESITIPDHSKQVPVSSLAAHNNPDHMDENPSVSLAAQDHQGSQFHDQSASFSSHQGTEASPIVITSDSDSNHEEDCPPQFNMDSDAGMSVNSVQLGILTLDAHVSGQIVSPTHHSACVTPFSSTCLTCESPSTSNHISSLKPSTQTPPQASPFASTGPECDNTPPISTSSGAEHRDTATLHNTPATPPTNPGTLGPILSATSSTTAQLTFGAAQKRKRRHRCDRCKPCLTLKCKQCINCTQPQRHKPCVKRFCEKLT